MPKTRATPRSNGTRMKEITNVARAAMKISVIFCLQKNLLGLVVELEPNVADVGIQDIGTTSFQFAQLIGQAVERLDFGLRFQSFDFNRAFGLNDFLISPGVCQT